MRELLQIYISFDTTLEDIQLLKKEIATFISDKENSRDFQPEFNVEVTGLASMYAWISSCINFANATGQGQNGIDR